MAANEAAKVMISKTTILLFLYLCICRCVAHDPIPCSTSGDHDEFSIMTITDSGEVSQGRRRRSGWSGLSRTNNLELNQLADQLELHYSHAIFGRSHLHVATYILQMLLKMHGTSSYLVSQPN